MRAAVFYGKEGIRMEDHPTPSVPEGKALIRVKASGICGGEYNTYRQRKNSPIPAKGIILGHEVVGEVVRAAGELREGDLAAVSPNSGCGTCWYCTHGIPYECRNKPEHTAETGGGYAEYLVTDPELCYVLPRNTSPVKMAMAEPLACCVHSVRRVGIRMGDRVAILGAGGGAQMFVQLARLQGASLVAVYDDMDDRLALAKSLGADLAVNTRENPEAVNGEYDVLIVTRSSAEFFERALAMADFRGRVLVYGVAAPETKFQAVPRLIWRKQLSVIGSRSFEGDAFETAVRLLLADRIETKPLINRIISLDQASWALEHSRGQIKTVIVPEGEQGRRV